MGRLSLGFVDPEREAAYQRHRAREQTQWYRGWYRLGSPVALLVSLLMAVAWFAGAEITNLPGYIDQIFERSVWLWCAASVLCYALYRLSYARLFSDRPEVFIAVMMASGPVMVMLPFQGMGREGVAYSTINLVVHILGVHAILRLGARLATLVGLLCIAQFILAGHMVVGAPLSVVITMSFYLAVVQVMGMYVSWRAEGIDRHGWERELLLEEAHERSENLLLNILPSSIAERLKAGETAIADGFAETTILFADLVGFTAWAGVTSPAGVVAKLNGLFSAFDDLADELGLEKIKTIGDCYMVAAGLPTERPDHADAIAKMALGMREIVAEHSLGIRIGINSGPVVAGVIGKRKFIYDLWGDAVNIAARMESHGQAGRIQISEATRNALGEGFALALRGTVQVKGKGDMQTWWLEG
jgi:class 3 adenylate cyclase